jgi:hypothetical protein
MFGNDRAEHSLIQSYVQQASHLTEYAIDVGFSSEDSLLRVHPKFAHKDIPDLTFSIKQALNNTISR